MDNTDIQEVYSTDSKKRKHSSEGEEDPTRKQCTNSSLGPDLDTCIVLWKKIFPWVEMESSSKKFVCLYCLRLIHLAAIGKANKAEVFTVKSPEDAFIVAKNLRDHNDSVSHCMAFFVTFHKQLLPLFNIYDKTFPHASNSAEFMETLRALTLGTQVGLPQLVNYVKYMGNVIEKRIVTKVKNCICYSVVADQCRGLMIVRVVEPSLQIEEFVLWSYMLVENQTPMQYARKFNWNSSKLTFYVANTPCQQCSRCNTTRISPAQLPPRPPPLNKFVELLWQQKLLRGLHEMAIALIECWGNFMSDFNDQCGKTTLESLFKFKTEPVVLVSVLENLSDLKPIMQKIYEKTGNLKALGFSQLTGKDSIHLIKALEVIQEIIKELSNVGQVDVITDEQIFTLNQYLVTLRNTFNVAKFELISREECIVFTSFVEAFIDENQKSVYYSGRDKLDSFYKICNNNSFMDDSGKNVDKQKLSDYLDVVYMAVSGFDDIPEKFSVFNSLVSFHKALLKDGIITKDVVSVIDVFRQYPSYCMSYQPAYRTYILNASLPFQPTHAQQDLFTAEALEAKYNGSFWKEVDPELKPAFLYFQSHYRSISFKNLAYLCLEIM